jgi:uncharacterized protein YjbJ (UPF0337 family)
MQPAALIYTADRLSDAAETRANEVDAPEHIVEQLRDFLLARCSKASALVSATSSGFHRGSLLSRFSSTLLDGWPTDCMESWYAWRRQHPGNGVKHMKSSAKDQIKGKLRELKGKTKEKAGRATNDPNLTARGQDEKVAGKIQKKVGQIKKVFGQ